MAPILVCFTLRKGSMRAPELPCARVPFNSLGTTHVLKVMYASNWGAGARVWCADSGQACGGARVHGGVASTRYYALRYHALRYHVGVHASMAVWLPQGIMPLVTMPLVTMRGCMQIPAAAPCAPVLPLSRGKHHTRGNIWRCGSHTVSLNLMHVRLWVGSHTVSLNLAVVRRYFAVSFFSICFARRYFVVCFFGFFLVSHFIF